MIAGDNIVYKGLAILFCKNLIPLIKKKSPRRTEGT